MIALPGPIYPVLGPVEDTPLNQPGLYCLRMLLKLGRTWDRTKQDWPLAWVANQLKPKMCPSHSQLLHQAWFEPGRVWGDPLFHPIFGPVALLDLRCNEQVTRVPLFVACHADT